MVTQGQKTAVVTGGNAGIGFETAKVLAQCGYRVVIIGRDETKLCRAVTAIRAMTNGDILYRLGDFASFASVRALARALLVEPRLDVLLNNVGVTRSWRSVTEDGNDMVLQVNHLSPFLLTHLLLDKIQASAPSRIVNVSSRSHRWARDPGFDDFQYARSFSAAKSYARTKLYNILFTRELARQLVGTGVTVNALHPGVIVSRIGLDEDVHGFLKVLIRAKQPFKSPSEAGSKVTCFVATAPELASVSGQYFSTRLQPEQPSKLARDDEAARRLWDMSYRLVGLR